MGEDNRPGWLGVEGVEPRSPMEGAGAEARVLLLGVDTRAPELGVDTLRSGPGLRPTTVVWKVLTSALQHTHKHTHSRRLRT